MSEREQFTRQVHRTEWMTVAFVAALVFGVILLATGDWIPGGMITVAALAGVAVQVQVIRKLGHPGSSPSPPTGNSAH